MKQELGGRLEGMTQPKDQTPGPCQRDRVQWNIGRAGAEPLRRGRASTHLQPEQIGFICIWV